MEKLKEKSALIYPILDEKQIARGSKGQNAGNAEFSANLWQMCPAQFFKGKIAPRFVGRIVCYIYPVIFGCIFL
jgi:hypothetical protein